MLKKLKAKNIPNAATSIYLYIQKHPSEFKTYIASFAPLADLAFKNNDGVAKRILKEAVDELFLGVKAVANKLAFKDKEVYIGYVGSVFTAPIIKSLLSAKIKKLIPQAHFISNIVPVNGAVLMALKLTK